jgi:DNA/RNA-binding domain of Phe-tRNA-synthetase-like protein
MHEQVAGDPGDEPLDGIVDAELTEELPGLRLRWTVVDAAGGRTPRALRQRLEDVSTRFRGANAIALRTRPVPRAYRAFFRQVGLDPDVDRTPVEQAAVERLIRGELHTGDRVADALVLAVIETGVPVVAFAEGALGGDVVLRAARTAETLPSGDYAHDVPAGRLVLADDHGPVAILFGRQSDRHAAGRERAPVRLVAIQVPGVPRPHVDEALWLAAGALSVP